MLKARPCTSVWPLWKISSPRQPGAKSPPPSPHSPRSQSPASPSVERRSGFSAPVLSSLAFHGRLPTPKRSSTSKWSVSREWSKVLTRYVYGCFSFKSFHQIVSTWFFRTSSALLKIRGGVKTLTWRLFLPRKRGIRELNFIFAFAYLRAVWAFDWSILTMILVQMLTPGALPAENKQAKPTL